MVLHRALDGDGPYPPTLWLGLLSEQLGCTPRQAYEEWQSWPVGFLEELLEARAYARAKATVEAETDPKAIRRVTEQWPLAAMAHQIHLELVRDARNAR